MAPPFLKKRSKKEASSRKLSVRIRSDQKETKQQRERRRAAISTGSANIRDEDMLARGVTSAASWCSNQGTVPSGLRCKNSSWCCLGGTLSVWSV